MSNRNIVSGYGGRYAVSSDGRVFTCNKELAQHVKNQYLTVHFSVSGKRISKTVHRLVAEAFIPNSEGKPQINHKDGNKLNNNLSNLEWATAKENMRHAFDTGLKVAKKGEEVWLSVLSEEDVIAIRGSSENNIELAKRYGVFQKTIYAARSGKTWKHLPGARVRRKYVDELVDGRISRRVVAPK